MDIVQKTLDTISEIDKEIKQTTFVLDQLQKANTALQNAINHSNDTMSKNGVDKQLDSIERACRILRDWIK